MSVGMVIYPIGYMYDIWVEHMSTVIQTTSQDLRSFQSAELLHAWSFQSITNRETKQGSIRLHLADYVQVLGMNCEKGATCLSQLDRQGHCHRESLL